MTSTDPALVSEAWAVINQAQERILQTESAAQAVVQQTQQEALLYKASVDQQAQEAVHQAQSQASATVNEVRNQATQVVHDTRTQASEAVNNARSQAAEATHQAQLQVQDSRRREEQALKAAEVSESRAQALEAEISRLTQPQMPSPIAARSPEPTTPMLPSNATVTVSDADINRRINALRSGDPSYNQVSPLSTSGPLPQGAGQSTPGSVPRAVREELTDTKPFTSKPEEPLVKPLSVPCLSGIPGSAPSQSQESFCRGCGSKLYGSFCSACGLRRISTPAPEIHPMRPTAPRTVPGTDLGDRGNDVLSQGNFDNAKAIAPPPPPPYDPGSDKTIFISPSAAQHTPQHVLPRSIFCRYCKYGRAIAARSPAKDARCGRSACSRRWW